jgi:hypothetical protein
MNQVEKLETIKYFLECYFNMSVDYKDLESLIDKFVSQENIKYSNQLLQELEWVIDRKKWDKLHEIVMEYGMRDLPNDVLHSFVNVLLKRIKK